MEVTRTKILAGAVLLSAVLLIAGIAYAKAAKTPVTGTRAVYPEGADREWIDDDGIWHVRGAYGTAVYSGDLAGTGSFVTNLNIDPATGNGDESGCVTADLSWEELSGTFKGRLSVEYTGGVGIGRGVYHGTGDFAGMKLMENFTLALVGPPYFVSFEGVVLDPHGE